MELISVPIDKPDDLNLILGQSHFIKTVEDLHEVLIGSSPHLRFGLAFCESSVRAWCDVPETTTNWSSWPPVTCSPSEQVTPSWCSYEKVSR